MGKKMNINHGKLIKNKRVAIKRIFYISTEIGFIILIPFDL